VPAQEGEDVPVPLGVLAQSHPRLRVAPGQPLDEAGGGRGEAPLRPQSLALRQMFPAHGARFQFQDQQPSPDAVAVGHVLAGGEDQSPGRPLRQELPVPAQAHPAGQVPLGAEETLRLPVIAPHVGGASVRGEVVHHAEGVLQ